MNEQKTAQKRPKEEDQDNLLLAISLSFSKAQKTLSHILSKA